jgi:hypothetical protein
MSNIWYSSEVAGTILVQCIPILRPFLREVHTSFTSREQEYHENGRYGISRSTGYSYEISGRQHSYGSYRNVLVGDKGHEFIKLQGVQEGSELDVGKGRGSSRNQVDQTIIKKPQL